MTLKTPPYTIGGVRWTDGAPEAESVDIVYVPKQRPGLYSILAAGTASLVSAALGSATLLGLLFVFGVQQGRWAIAVGILWAAFALFAVLGPNVTSQKAGWQTYVAVMPGASGDEMVAYQHRLSTRIDRGQMAAYGFLLLLTFVVALEATRLDAAVAVGGILLFVPAYVYNLRSYPDAELAATDVPPERARSELEAL
ncbi:hypothetical protein ACFQJC_00310 [Haloferax namakaokahaiae]|uniref:Uncharacterized protein n=1 Tax=Haloferax namakaokahaiae TaxID=1748331 RepID=A0ABD5Z9V3_9EURY